MRRELQRLEDAAAIPGSAALAMAQDHFALLGFARAYDIDTGLLRKRFRDLQRQLHPDRFAQAPPAERQASASLAARVNDAYSTLRDPLGRASYLLGLEGMDARAAPGPALSAAFLETQMDWREDFEAACGARDRTAFEVLTRVLREEMRWRYETLGNDLTEGKYPSAARLVMELRFLERLATDVVEAIDRWEVI